MIQFPSRRSAAALALLLCTACVERESPIAPIPPEEEAPPVSAPSLMQLRCDIEVASGAMTCARSASSRRVSSRDMSGPRFDRILGGQDLYVMLVSSGTSYDAGTEVLQSNVTLQNLLDRSMGTTDGVTPIGTRIFFVSGPTTTSGVGTVSVANADGVGTFTASDQPYLLYPGILAPFEISAPRNWQFSVPATVATFSFTVAVSAPLVDEAAPLLNTVWEGGVSGEWELAENWRDDLLPDSLSTVSILSDSLFAGEMPVLSAPDTVLHIRVGIGSILDLGSHVLEARGNVDAAGVVSNGTLRMSGSGTLLKGAVDKLDISGSVVLQESTSTTGPLSVTGSLATPGHPLSIVIP